MVKNKHLEYVKELKKINRSEAGKFQDKFDRRERKHKTTKDWLEEAEQDSDDVPICPICGENLNNDVCNSCLLNEV